MKPISFGTVKRLVQQSKQFKGFRTWFKETLRSYSEFPEAIDITVSGTFHYVVKWSEYGDLDKSCVLHLPVSIRVIAQREVFNVDDYFTLVAKQLFMQVTHAVNEWCFKEHCGWIEIQSIELDETDKDYIYCSKFIAWNCGTVAIWYVEQECGERWITLPVSPNVDIPVLYTSFDRKLKEAKSE